MLKQEYERPLAMCKPMKPTIGTSSPSYRSLCSVQCSDDIQLNNNAHSVEEKQND